MKGYKPEIERSKIPGPPFSYGDLIDLGKKILPVELPHNNDLAWAAGIIDGEGTITITKSNRTTQGNINPTFVLYLTVSMTHQPAVERLQSIFGEGKIYFRKPGKNSVKDSWAWTVSAKKAESVLRKIAPYLFVKYHEALTGILFQQFSTSKRSVGRTEKAKPETIQIKNWYYNYLRQMKVDCVRSN